MFVLKIIGFSQTDVYFRQFRACQAAEKHSGSRLLHTVAIARPLCADAGSRPASRLAVADNKADKY